jgi:ubiquitin C-terminal hydrolase
VAALPKVYYIADALDENHEMDDGITGSEARAPLVRIGRLLTTEFPAALIEQFNSQVNQSSQFQWCNQTSLTSQVSPCGAIRAAS